MSGTTFGFTGQRFDAETGLYFYKNRYYSSKLGRFLEPDPIYNRFGRRRFKPNAGCGCGCTGCGSPSPFTLLERGNLNQYQYAENDPLNRVDPLGLLDALTDVSVGLAAVGLSEVVAAVAAVAIPVAIIIIIGGRRHTLNPLRKDCLDEADQIEDDCKLEVDVAECEKVTDEMADDILEVEGKINMAPPRERKYPKAKTHKDCEKIAEDKRIECRQIPAFLPFEG
jgi:RHS repeat-associated protein